jgi:hypothetical protein
MARIGDEMYGKMKGHHCWWLTRDGKELANFDNEEEVDRIINMEAGRRDVATCLENAIVSAKSAYIAGVAESPEKGMEWLHNYLWGPGLLPTDEELAAGAQAFFDENHKGY